MKQEKYNFTINHLCDSISEGIFRKKGNSVLKINLEKTGSAFCDCFIICDAESTTKTSAIANSIIETVRNDLDFKPFHKEGFENSQWILLDFGNVVVHIFLKEIRGHYNLEDLWADAPAELIIENTVKRVTVEN